MLASISQHDVQWCHFFADERLLVSEIIFNKLFWLVGLLRVARWEFNEAFQLKDYDWDSQLLSLNGVQQ